MIEQRKHNECGAAALASLLGKTYEQVGEAWGLALGRETDASTYQDLIDVAGALGVTITRSWFRKSEGMRRIVRVRPWPGSDSSHWIVMIGCGMIWCPYSGWHDSLDVYEQPCPGRTFIIG